ncbi:MTRF1L release factor glutamine methyltransferase-like [Branchiostoma floridae]|uniref:peptide chain release factor N(5)-glutamine methyltransferase n=1 Tax=Branchiostoma floridae TaxID=7739 RepID=A0A9J7MQG5_BRAFL|nr:MTRF1L release factor glutamine methyltransferase-like [Branchiostoma floridae]
MRHFLQRVLQSRTICWNRILNPKTYTQGVRAYCKLEQCCYPVSLHCLNNGSFRSESLASSLHSPESMNSALRTYCTNITRHDLRSEDGGWSKDTLDNISILEAVSYWTRKFETAGVPEPGASAEYITGHVLGFKSFSLISPLAQSVTAEERTKVWDLCEKRMNRVPIQYILGEWDFRDLNLVMRPPVFIPRPETEELVEHLWLYLQEDLTREDEELDILEVGCGSGAISLSLLHEFPQAHCTAVDVTKEAVELTQHNAERLGLCDRLNVKQMQFNTSADFETKFDVIVSNPPYIWTQDMGTLEQEIVGYENHCALHGGTDGMGLIRDIIHTGHRLLKPGGSIWLEVDPRHPDMIQTYLNNHLQYQLHLAGVYQDFNERPRFCCLELRE